LSRKTKPEQFRSGLVDVMLGGVWSQPCLETDPEVSLALARSVPLARASRAVQSETSIADIVGRRVYGGIRPAADLHAIQDIEKFHSQFRGNAFAKEEFLGDGDIFVALEGIPERGNIARGRSGRELSWIGKGSRIEDRQAFVVVVPIQTDRLPSQVGAIEAVQERISARGDSERLTAGIGKITAELPASNEIFGNRTASVQKFLSGTNRQLIDAGNIEDVGLVVAGDRPLLLLIEFIQRIRVKRRETSVGVRHSAGEGVSSQKTEAV
jgi:hypothetical protein